METLWNWLRFDDEGNRRDYGKWFMYALMVVTAVLVFLLIALVVLAVISFIQVSIYGSDIKSAALAECKAKGGTWNEGQVNEHQSYWCSYPPTGR